MKKNKKSHKEGHQKLQNRKLAIEELKEYAERPKIRMVWSDDLGRKALKELRKRVNTALKNPNYCILTNYTLNWKEVDINKEAKFRMVYSDRIKKEEVEDLKEQVDKALTDPNFVIVTNYEVFWVEVA